MIPKVVKQSLPEPKAPQDEVLSLHKKLEAYEIEIRLLREENKLLKHKIFGSKSERYVEDDGSEQGSLFGELSDTDDSESPENTSETITVPAHTRKKRGRKPLPESLERMDIIHDISDKDKQCGCGCQMSRIGEATSERLQIKPAVMWVERHIRYKYACKNCEGVDKAANSPTVKIAAVPVQLIAKSITTPSLLSHIIVGKFTDSLPFYRQEQQFLRNGVNISRGSMCNWTVKVAEKCQPLLELLQNQLLSGPLIQIDETVVQVLKEPDRDADAKSYMWVFRGGTPGKPLIIYRYAPSRSGNVPKSYLGNYQGCIQTDGYSGYRFLDTCPGIVHAACWAHVRRKFYSIIQSIGKKKKKKSGIGKADHALKTIKTLYEIERKADAEGLSPEERIALRQSKSKPILIDFKEWLSETALVAPPQSLLGKALNYTLGQWPRLLKYLEHSELTLDNNLAENAIRPFVIGRKNWLFSDQPGGADASAVFYGLVETAKANQLEPYSYFLYLLDRLPLAVTEEDYLRLLPTTITAEDLNEYKTEYWKKNDLTD